MSGMVEQGQLVAIFHSIHRVMAAEKALKLARLPMQLIPVPRDLASDCGLAIRIAPQDWPQVLATLAREDLVPAELYRKHKERFVSLPLADEDGTAFSLDKV